MDTISIRKFTKGNDSAKNAGGATVVNLFTSSGHALYSYQVVKLSRTVSKLKGYCTVFQHALKSLEITGFVLS